MNKIKEIIINLRFKITPLLRLLVQRIFVKKNLPIAVFAFIGILVVSGIIFGVYKLITKTNDINSSQIQVAPAKAVTVIGKEFIFPLKNEKGNEVSRIKYTIESAELRSEIVVKGQKARSVKGRIFFILNLKVVNDFKQKIEIQTTDYIRLSVNGNKDVWLAPDIHSDPAGIQAISTKYIKVGFAINESDKDLILRVGEINGEKEEFPVKF
ncbi:MAG: hypothetical protein UR39_C0001G0042 [Candidatus Woesebacteria bacterium GW2011_GWA1_33_30]|uniref:DUF4352 domain-containing protein n=1 Tax=Candidatus Woesebacteria bacterium GW2011_GWA2_33_28 TaxID=1618561 RepID=A0A0G0CXZ2_9BACT|nr:MAG: hypothetical protein UR38_C0001G0043 [Candidatus Woesebacteria bacterium GW2011_GWA2_33_28]KKP49009.1 MAG: hypothetical protein UR39_C0001G0042 [Candidatus Woesebacteria bacterium GW2011_GWA1_33_30]KKP49883.1 MAG: hypothetical protein UR40_C0003G0055 [Microgenomates group bacterium GW2011_GWC1_33_32]KKP52601.1 MAG: hypothetical protein UR44_C0001G0043 [Candidatus Woesebacteria bacterium GW2011_GWB1_33_38]